MPNALIVASLAESLLNFRKELLIRLQREGYVVHVAAPELDGELREQLRDLGCITHSIPLQRNGLNPAADLKTLQALRALCRDNQPQLVLAYTIKPVIYGMLAAWLTGVRTRVAMITGLGFAFTAEPTGLRKWIARVARLLYRTALSKAGLVFFQNPDDRDLFVQQGLVGADKCQLINGSGVNVSHYAVVPPASTEQGVHFLLIARLLADKGVREYVAAARQVKQRYPNAVFHLVGWRDSNPTAVTQEELDQWSSDGSIVFHGKLADVRPVINMCHVYVLPSYREGTPRTVLEAMSVGRAIITTDAPGCRETVKQGFNGFLVPVADAQALADTMQRFLVSPDLIVSMGAAARQFVEQKYDVNAVNDSIIDAIRHV